MFNYLIATLGNRLSFYPQKKQDRLTRISQFLKLRHLHQTIAKHTLYGYLCAMEWYAIRVTYGREKKFCKVLEEKGFETFVPAVSNLCFVKTEKEDLDSYMAGLGDVCPARYIWDKATRKPIIVPDKAMEDFIRVSRFMADEALYLEVVSPKIREGQRVRVKAGPLMGVEGVVTRVKRSRRVVVELPGIMAIATTYIAITDLEII